MVAMPDHSCSDDDEKLLAEEKAIENHTAPALLIRHRGLTRRLLEAV
jgi:hypothetical protein